MINISDLDHLGSRFWSLWKLKIPQKITRSGVLCGRRVQTKYVIRQLVEKALYIKRLTPDIENEINYELTRLGHISDADYEALELLMSEMDAGRIQLVPNI